MYPLFKYLQLAVLLLALSTACGSNQDSDKPSEGTGRDGGTRDAATGNDQDAAGDDQDSAVDELAEDAAVDPIDEPDEPELSPERRARNAYLRDRLEEYLATRENPAVAAAVVVGNEIQAAAVAGVRRAGSPEPARLGDYFMLKSCTKPMTGYLAARVMQLEPKVAPGSSKTFSWNTTILDVFPELASLTNPAYEQTTVAQLMSHSSGMPYQPRTEGQDEFANITSDLRERRFEYVKAAVQDEPEDPSPYGGGSIIVAAMMERITGRSWEDLMQEYVFDELGMTNAGMGSAPYPPSMHATTSHVPSADGPVPWTPPEHYAEEVHAPAGRNPHASVLDVARFLSAQLPNVSDRPGMLETSYLLGSHAQATESVAQGGWMGGLASNYIDQVFNHDGSDGRDYAIMEIYPGLDVGAVVMTNYPEEDARPLLNEVAAVGKHPGMAARYTAELAAPKTATATNVYAGSETYDADKAVDGLLGTRWATDEWLAAITIQLGTTRTVSELLVAEPPQYARVEGFIVSVETDDGWQEVATGTKLGPSHSITFDPVTTSAIRLEVTESSGQPTLAEIWVP